MGQGSPRERLGPGLSRTGAAEIEGRVFCESVPFRLFVLLADSDELGWGCLGERVRKKREKGSEQWEDE